MWNQSVYFSLMMALPALGPQHFQLPTLPTSPFASSLLLLRPSLRRFDDRVLDQGKSWLPLLSQSEFAPSSDVAGGKIAPCPFRLMRQFIALQILNFKNQWHSKIWPFIWPIMVSHFFISVLLKKCLLTYKTIKHKSMKLDVGTFLDSEC